MDDAQLNVDCRRLAADLAAGLSTSAPEGFIIRDEPPGHVAITLVPGHFPDDHTWNVNGVCDIVEQEGDVAKHVWAACYSVISTVQDFIVETIHRPWPQIEHNEPGSSTTLPSPEVVMEGSVVHLSYLLGSTVVLRLPSIDLRPRPEVP